MTKLKIGAAHIPVALDEGCFPSTEAVGQHDEIAVRVLIMETDRRYALMSVDTPSMFPPDLAFCRRLLKETADVEPENAFIAATHNFSAPHVWPVEPEHAAEFGYRLPPALRDDAEKRRIAARVNAAFRAAYTAAVRQSAAALRPARVGFGSGSCAVNVNRNMETAEGWWQGVDMDGFADRTLSVLRFDDLAGEPVALVYNYSVQPSCCAGEIRDGGRLVSGDLTGYASAYLEREYPGCTAIFLAGATNDQVPLFKINYFETDRNGVLRSGSLGETGYVLAGEQGRLLGASVLKVARGIAAAEDAPVLRTARSAYVCRRQKRDGSGRLRHPVRAYSFQPDGECTLTAEVMQIGNVAIAALAPELDGRTVAELREASPFAKTMVATFVNGEGKSMPQAAAYRLCQYGLANSPFAEGSAERARDAALGLLRSL